jgi:hypothetical protein
MVHCDGIGRERYFSGDKLTTLLALITLFPDLVLFLSRLLGYKD